jgi:hypothetical protein
VLIHKLVSTYTSILVNMSSFWSKLLACALVGSCAAHVRYSSSSSPTTSRSCNVTQIEGCNATGETTKIDASQ